MTSLIELRDALAKLDPSDGDYAARAVDLMLAAAGNAGASDIHAQPNAEGLQLQMRLDGLGERHSLGQRPGHPSSPPAESARVLARRANCSSNLTQLGLALQSYEAAHTTLPPEVSAPKGPIKNLPDGQQYSWIVYVLPYIEERVTYQHIDLSKDTFDQANSPAREVSLPLTVCPTYAGGARCEGGAIADYAGCHHDVEAPIDADNNGVLYLNSRIASSRDVTDGTSHTIYLGEKLGGSSELGWISGTPATLRNTGTPLSMTTWDTCDGWWADTSQAADVQPGPDSNDESFAEMGEDQRRAAETERLEPFAIRGANELSVGGLARIIPEWSMPCSVMEASTPSQTRFSRLSCSSLGTAPMASC